MVAIEILLQLDETLTLGLGERTPLLGLAQGLHFTPHLVDGGHGLRRNDGGESGGLRLGWHTERRGR
ncbi:hypothetical protein HUA74_18580 [Myxococcus sp. CA051A]|uniref:hypothetical protein n=1 Tax=unclassified Myxococcus TaxID=2648731 RepID=UPI00157A31BA|nr:MULTISPECIES: hypothetical protein [unclassified Myxococcus]NTX06663.1 hypothetical protein [Myxococcus sp. CA040A]NTX62659.1 hypothetical protein [Myxococcus sp. CA051A]